MLPDGKGAAIELPKRARVRRPETMRYCILAIDSKRGQVSDEVIRK